ncbi:MAG: enterochelin esterase, partial [Chloroflexi bacterium]
FAGGVPPAVVVFIDAWTSLGGSQFLNSTAIGRYLDYVCDDVVPFVDARYPTVARPAARGLAGHSSGGYGAMVVPMLRPGIFGAIASHSGDALFEYSYMSDIAAAVRTLRDKYGGSYDEFWTDFRSRPAYTHSADGPLQNVYAMAAAYSAEPDGTVTLPFDIPSGLPRPDVWERWRALDPVYMVPKRIPQLKALRGIYLDAGKRDEHYLDLGTVAFASQLAAAGVEYTLELHDGSHSRIEYRFPSAWRFLAERLSAE